MLVIVPGSEVDQHRELMNRVYRFRHSIFVEEKGWEDLRQPDGLERDQFDRKATIHQICLRDGEIIGYQRLLPTTGPHLLKSVLRDLCHKKPPRGPKIFEWTRFCVAPGHREFRPSPTSAFLELTQGVVEWGIAHGIDTVTVAIDWRLMVLAMQLRFFVRPLGFPKRIGKEEIVALRMSFNHKTLATLHEARGNTDSVLVSGDQLLTAA